jgi:Heparan-alpha-glucosaminide N-acetyltransferase, catalytic
LPGRIGGLRPGYAAGIRTDTLILARPHTAPSPPVPSPSGPGGARAEALDRLRGVALAAMLVHHLVDWTTGDARGVLPGWRGFAVTDAAAVMFFVAAGASLVLFVTSRRARGLPRRHVAAQVLRRYGLLVPAGMALDWVLWRDPLMCGVLEVLGATVVLGAAVSAAVPTRVLPAVSAAVVCGGVWSEHAVAGRAGWWSTELIGGKFPLVTYLGFVLVGAAAVRTGWYADRRTVVAAAAGALLLTVALLAAGLVPDRYPGDVRFVVPGLAVTVAVYALAQLRWGPPFAGLDRIVRGAAAYTLGIFLAHYAVYALVRGAGRLGDVPGGVAVPAAVVVTGVLCLAAPRVPQPAWSLRTGRRGATRTAPGLRTGVRRARRGPGPPARARP